MKRDYLGWYKLKATIEQQRNAPDFSQRDVWWCSLGANIGFEEDGKNDNFERPVLIIRKFNKELFIGLPLTSTKKDSAFYHPVSVAHKKSAVILSQQRALSAKRLLRKIGRVGEADFSTILIKVAELLKNANPATSAGFSDANGDLYPHTTKHEQYSQGNDSIFSEKSISADFSAESPVPSGNLYPQHTTQNRPNQAHQQNQVNQPYQGAFA